MVDVRTWSPGLYHVIAKQGSTRIGGRVMVVR
jgi:hypothetical protein